MQLALAFILIRTIARLVQISSGLSSTLSQSQVYIVVLDGALVLLAVIFLTIVPPGPSFGRAWGATSPSKKKARRYLANLDLAQHHHHRRASLQSPSYRLHEHESPYPSPQSYQAGSGYGYSHDYGFGGRGSQRYSQGRGSGGGGGHKRQASAASSCGATEHQQPLPAYERPFNNYAQVPYVPAPEAAVSLSQQYGQGRVVESQVVVPGSEGVRTGGTGGTGGSGGRTRTRSSPRVYEEDMVRHDAIW